jgi:RimJ/RimL family protein N-acetyltransferase
MFGMGADTALRLEPWDDRGVALEIRANVAEMKTYLGGIEPDQSIVEREARIRTMVRDGKGRMFLIMIPGEPDPVGSVGFWEKEWQGEAVYELGWKVLPAFQGRGIAAKATVATIGLAGAAEAKRRWAHAFPRVDNTASNAVCRKAGFALVGECDFEYPKGNPIRCNDWRYDLTALSGSASGSGSISSRA